MSPNHRLLPLFPLNVVLFPNAVLPIHVFEERYKLMVERCVEKDSRFGVVLIRSGLEVGDPAEPYTVGTVVRILRLTRLDGGRMRIAVAGEKRFRLIEITQERPYMEARVEELEEESVDILPPTVFESVREAAAGRLRLLSGLRGGWVRNARLPQSPVYLSYYIATLLELDLAGKQSLLETPSAAARLETELRMLNHGHKDMRERVVRELRKRFSRQ